MKRATLAFTEEFKVALTARTAQAAEMVIAPGAAEGGKHNRHAGADQWLFVVSGSGLALIEGSRHRLKKGVLVMIASEEQHEIRNTGRSPLRTLNFYTPPAYRSDGNPLPRGRSKPRGRQA